MANLEAVFSGPIATRANVVDRLRALGFTVQDEVHGTHDWGLSSYRNETEAALAGRWNSGHTPGTPHPDTGEPYAADPRISFVTVQADVGDSEHSPLLGRAAGELDRYAWYLRKHWHKQLAILTAEQVRELRGPAANLSRVGRG